MSNSGFFDVPEPDRSPSAFDRAVRRIFLAAAGGAAGGYFGYLCGEPAAVDGDASRLGGAQMMLTTVVWVVVVGTILGLTILAAGNVTGLGGKWYRNLGIAVPILMVGCGLSGGLAQLVYGSLLWLFGLAFGPSLLEAVLVRAFGWAILGIGVGASVGLSRFNWKQITQGAIGGCIGGYLGGVVFDAVAQVNHAHNGSDSRCIGLIVLGAFIAAGIGIVQQLFNSAWLLGVSTGPYEGKEYCLDSPSVSVGRSARNQIALYRDESLPDQLGALVNRNGSWRWEGLPITINGVTETSASVVSGSRLDFGTYGFKFSDRSLKAPAVPSTDPAPIMAPPRPAVPFTRAVPPAAPYVADPPKPATSTQAPPSAVSAPQPRSGLGNAPPAATGRTGGGRTGSGALTPADRLILRPRSGNWPRFTLGRAASAALGRTPENDWCLPDEAVSSRHAFFVARDGRLMVTDLDSTNGTVLNGLRLKPREAAQLRAGDRIQFGEVEYVVEGE